MLFGITVDYFTWEKNIIFEGEMIRGDLQRFKSNTLENEYSYSDQLLKVSVGLFFSKRLLYF